MDETLIDVYELQDVENSDQIRDLFIRLQSGTALTRQQIRDAWPGNVGPFVEHLAGKLSTKPTCDLFRLIDRRGTRSDDDDLSDEYVGDLADLRATSAAFPCPRAGSAGHSRRRGRRPRCSLTTNTQTLKSMERPRSSSNDAWTKRRSVFALVAPLSTPSTTGKTKRTKVRKIDAFATVMFFQDVLRSPHFHIDLKEQARLARRMGEFERDVKPSGKGTSGQAMREHYEKFREMRGRYWDQLDPKRSFSDEEEDQRHARWWIGAVCRANEHGEAAEADHYPTPWRDGGRTSPDNGRIVHARCHPRGRPRTPRDGHGRSPR